ncbi:MULTISPECIES: hypothetical protein [Aeromonas]|uniref:hypothetical protein n=1 Tax=Aeromonas hydrophila TaxID=644 RepID=UPI0029D55045|nr:hypothetical protein [Aeromonas hydrophila]MDX7778340.1 hypothetical protein [Aeromonas hydrophila]
MGNRIGKFAVSGHNFRTQNYELMRAIQRDMVVLDIEHNVFKDVSVFTAEHPEFHEIGEGVIPPTYGVVVEVDGDDNMVVKFTRGPDDA